MPTANVNLNPQHEARLSYSGFDMGQSLDFTSSVGQLLPVYYDILSPGDKVDCRAIIRTRTAPLNTACTMSITEHVEWFFVPMEQLYSAFGNVYYGIQDFDSAVFANKRIDGLPYANLYGLLGSDMSSYLNLTDDEGDSYVRGFIRLCEHLGLPINSYINQAFNSADGTFPVSPLLFCAYQKIFSDYYRISNREANQPQSYNLDDFIANETRTISVPDFLGRFGKLHYRPWKHDFFKGNQISPSFGDNSVGAQTVIGDPNSRKNILGQLDQWLSGLSNVTPSSPSAASQFPDGGVTTSDSVTPTTVKVLPTSGSSNVSQSQMQTYTSIVNPANIRGLFASEKLLEITRRAGKHYDAQTLAHWGVKVPQGIDGEVLYLGEQSARINIGDVISNADTAGAPLGEIAGKGYSYGTGESCKFEARSHGILMAIYSAEPEAYYYQDGIDKLATIIDRVEFPIPEYENLGMQPVFGYQSEFQANASQDSMVLGWQYRYQEFKQKYDRVIGAFNYNQSLKAWVNGYRPQISVIGDYYIRPDALNGLMVYPYDKRLHSSEPWEDWLKYFVYESDPLYHFFFFDVKKSSKMSVYGLATL